MDGTWTFNVGCHLPGYFRDSLKTRFQGGMRFMFQAGMDWTSYRGTRQCGQINTSTLMIHVKQTP